MSSNIHRLGQLLNRSPLNQRHRVLFLLFGSFSLLGSRFSLCGLGLLVYAVGGLGIGFALRADFGRDGFELGEGLGGGGFFLGLDVGVFVVVHCGSLSG